ncbi:hypothetical protein [Streptomyces swartbergensis]|uniref:Uncharacterized protein n=1 Tax=Streptomyces swartbergensis TaxID=487165 RepID=A0A243S879_9ACTN|nr:hypothetical protein [Streptomyces swartbergensis]OUD03915.1 hypothetical protein CA983_06980 [Streptomyces swartbergensis]
MVLPDAALDAAADAAVSAAFDLIAATTERPRGITERRDQLESRLRDIEATALRALESGAGVLSR